MSIKKIPAESVDIVTPNAGNCSYVVTDFAGKVIPNTGVYDLGLLGTMVQCGLIDIAKQSFIREDDNIKQLKEDDYKHKVYNREELHTTHTTEDKDNGMYKVVLFEDEKTGDEYSAIDLIASVNITTNELTAKGIAEVIEQNKITAPITNNTLSPPYRRNPIFNASKDPIKTPWDISKYLFDHCHSELNSGSVNFPYGAFQLYDNVGPETARGQLIFKFKDPKILHLVYYVNHDKSNPRYFEVPDCRILMFTMNMQNSKESPELISLRDAVLKGIVSNELVAYFIGTIYEIYKCIEMSEKLRFKQQSAECWVAEVQCSDCWIECAKISVKNDAALEAKLDQIEVEEAVKTLLKHESNSDIKMLVEEHKAIVKERKETMPAHLDSKGLYCFGVLLFEVIINPKMLTKEKKTVYVAEFILKIGRTVSYLYEHAYRTRPCKDGRLPIVFSFPSGVAPFKCFVIGNKTYTDGTKRIKNYLEEAGIPYMFVTAGKYAWNKLIISDQCGCPFALRPRSDSLVAIYERDTGEKISVPLDLVRKEIQDLLSGAKWADISSRYDYCK